MTTAVQPVADGQFVVVRLSDLNLGKFGPNPNKMDELRYRLLVKNLLDQREGRSGGKQVAPDEALLQPILVQDDTLNVIDGEHRVLASMEAGWTHVTCRLVACDDARAKALRLGLNNIRGETDLTIAAADLDFLAKEGWSPEDMSLTGFTGPEITTLLDLGSDGAQNDLAHNAAATVAEEETGDSDETSEWTLEIKFSEKKTYQAAKKKLKKLAGKGSSLAVGLMKALED